MKPPHHFFELVQDLQVEFEEEAEGQGASKLHLSPRSRGRQGHLLQEDVVGPAEGLLTPRPDGDS